MYSERELRLVQPVDTATEDQGEGAARATGVDGSPTGGEKKPDNGSGGGDSRGSNGSGLHPLLAALFETLPEPDTNWPEAEREMWLRFARGVLSRVYPDE